MPDFREIRAISQQTSHIRLKTSRFFCKDPHPARYYVCNSPHFKQSPQDATQRKLLKTLRRGTELRSRALPRTRRKENIPKLCVATQNHAAEYRFFCKDYHPARDFVHNSPRFTDNRLPSDRLSIKQGILRTKHTASHFTIAGHAPPHHQNKRVRQRFLCQTLYSCISGSNRRSRLFAYRLITPDVPPDGDQLFIIIDLTYIPAFAELVQVITISPVNGVAEVNANSLLVPF